MEEQEREPGLDKLQQMARQMEERRERKLTGTIGVASVGGGLIRAKMNGHRILLSIDLDSELVAPERRSELEQLIVEAVNAAAQEVDRRLGSEFGWSDSLPSLFLNQHKQRDGGS